MPKGSHLPPRPRNKRGPRDSPKKHPSTEGGDKSHPKPPSEDYPPLPPKKYKKGAVDSRTAKMKKKIRSRGAKRGILVGRAMTDAVAKVRGHEDADRELRRDRRPREAPEPEKCKEKKDPREEKAVKDEIKMEEENDRREYLNNFDENEVSGVFGHGESFTFYGRSHLLGNLLRVIIIFILFSSMITMIRLIQVWKRDGFFHMFSAYNLIMVLWISIVFTFTVVLLPYAFEHLRRFYIRSKGRAPPRGIIFPQIWKLTRKWVVTNKFFEAEKYLKEPGLALIKGVLMFEDHRTDSAAKTEMLHLKPLFAQYGVVEYDEAGFDMDCDLIVSHELLAQIMTPRNTAGNISSEDQRTRLYHTANSVSSINFRRHQVLKPGYNCSNDTVLYATFLLEYYRQTREFLPDVASSEFGQDFRLSHRSVRSH